MGEPRMGDLNYIIFNQTVLMTKVMKGKVIFYFLTQLLQHLTTPENISLPSACYLLEVDTIFVYTKSLFSKSERNGPSLILTKCFKGSSSFLMECYYIKKLIIKFESTNVIRLLKKICCGSLVRTHSWSSVLVRSTSTEAIKILEKIVSV